MFDYHLHSTFSDDARSPMPDVIEAAIAQGLEGIALTDHLDPFYQDDEYPWELDLPRYWDALTAAEEQFGGRIRFAKGIELGMTQGEGVQACEDAVTAYPFDFVIASVHHTKRAPIHTARFLEGRPMAAVIEEYYTEVLACIRAFKSYDVLGHLNVIDRYTEGYAAESVYMPYAEEILKQAIADGKGIEVNTSTFRYGMADRGTPTPAILRRYKELGGEIVTTGSDAHDARSVGAFIKEGEEILLAHGFRYVATFRGHVPTLHKL
ncbi:MAG: histidinol-phosphatase HisJ family protein [Clostridiales Family XIII bacterium]|jgi:histidinol-phosphatase (PHP family)|nr:histidinol-phosphatase HisJ family protein [Clostridiales Family XIII bacterium]